MTEILSTSMERCKNESTTHPDQFGFHAQHSTTSQLINVIDYIAEHFNKKYKTAAALKKGFRQILARWLLVQTDLNRSAPTFNKGTLQKNTT